MAFGGLNLFQSLLMQSFLSYFCCLFFFLFFFGFFFLGGGGLGGKRIKSSSIYLSLLSRSFSDHHLRCGGWLNLEYIVNMVKGKNIQDGPLKLFTRSRSEAC